MKPKNADNIGFRFATAFLLLLLSAVIFSGFEKKGSKMKDIYEVLKAISELPMFSECKPLTPTSQSPLGTTPLHVAAICGDNEAVEVLVEKGALINAVGDQGYTPLHEAAEQGNADTVALLLSLGADPTLTTSSGQTYDQLTEIAA